MKLSVLFLPVLLGLPFAATGLDEPQFEKLHDELKPAPDDAWRALPWELSILAAQARAAGEKKPVYMLVRSGHPLGCV